MGLLYGIFLACLSPPKLKIHYQPLRTLCCHNGEKRLYHGLIVLFLVSKVFLPYRSVNPCFFLKNVCLYYTNDRDMFELNLSGLCCSRKLLSMPGRPGLVCGPPQGGQDWSLGLPREAWGPLCLEQLFLVKHINHQVFVTLETSLE